MLAPVTSSFVSTLQSSVASPSPLARSSGIAVDASFGDMVSHLFSGAVHTVQSGETAAIQTMQGSLAPAKAVDAIMSAERALQTTLAIRDKLVGAYQEITRMSI